MYREEDHHGRSSSSSSASQFLWKKLFPSRNINSNSNGNTSSSSKKKKRIIGPRRRKTIEEWEEEERLEKAEALRLKDEQVKRERYLIKKIQNIRIIERVIDLLSISRYPAHHKPLPHSKLQQQQQKMKIPGESIV